MNDQQLDLLLRAADPATELTPDDLTPPMDLLDDIVASRHTGPTDLELARSLPDEPTVEVGDRDVAEVVPLRSRRRRRLAVLAAAALTTGAIGFLAIRSETPAPMDSVGCYADASTAADTSLLLAGSLQEAVDACRELWQAGEMDDDVPARRDVPDLIPCVLDSGAVGVFPARSCDDVERPPSPTTDGDGPTSSDDPSAAPTTPETGLPLPEHLAADPEVGEVMETIRFLLLDRCLPAEQAVPAVREVLDRGGLTTWTIEVVGQHGPSNCAAFSPDLERETVLLPPR